MTTIRVGIDTAADEIFKTLPYEHAVKAAARVMKEGRGIEVWIFGHEKTIQELVDRHCGAATKKPVVKGAAGHYTMEKKIIFYDRNGSQSSLDLTINRLILEHKSGSIQGVFSPGESGTTVISAMRRLRSINGVNPALVIEIPKSLEDTMLLGDVGAVITQNEYDLLDIGVMASTYWKTDKKDGSPRIGLVSNGTEETKGTKTMQAALSLYKQYAGKLGLNFAGYTEPNGLHEVDIAICDGYLGNIILKSVEGALRLLKDLFTEDVKRSQAVMRAVKKAHVSSGLLLYKKLLHQANPKSYGGAPLLGVNGNVLIGHGKTSEESYYSAILKTAEIAKYDLTARIHSEILRTREIVKK
jgi:glycerol-3-phosphate acyltransferase PlsX